MRITAKKEIVDIADRYVGSMDLCERYDFVQNKASGVLISADEIRQTARMLDERIVSIELAELILSLAEELPSSSFVHDNFIACQEEGRLEIGGDMKEIKENAEKIKRWIEERKSPRVTRFTVEL